MKKLMTSVLAVPLMVMAADNCVLQERTVNRSAVIIKERSGIRSTVVSMPNGDRKCVVDFRVRVGAEWHTAFGEYQWTGNRPDNEACAIATDRAEDAVRQRVGQTQTANERLLICKDEPALNVLRTTAIGTIGDVAQFRPHPVYTERFYHNGAQCKWFLENVFTKRDVRLFQGIICEVQNNQWVVVDKF